MVFIEELQEEPSPAAAGELMSPADAGENPHLAAASSESPADAGENQLGEMSPADAGENQGESPADAGENQQALQLALGPAEHAIWRQVQFDGMNKHCAMCFVHGVDSYEATFGRLTFQKPWGENFWQDFTAVIGSYWSEPGRHKTWVADLPTRMCRFILPTPFSQDAAQVPRLWRLEDLAAEGRKPALYPAFCYGTALASTVFAEPNQMFYMVRVNLALKGSRPWYVHSSWLML